ncbi:MAG: late competence development ComFB family protein [Spirochaetales bacterium]|nr:late competence development ComFB family protein [Spirochaetales bacterium]
MKIHNLMEEIVLDKIDEIIKDYKDRKLGKDLKTAEKYKFDVACYVLNRIEPVYVVSGRGLAYLDADYIDQLQKNADLVTLIHQGIERVMNVQRPYYDKKKKKDELERKGDFYNFPIIKGRIFNSLNFEPLFGVQIQLNYQGKCMKMIEDTWQNPYSIPEKTAGKFLFLPYPLKAENKGDKRSFELEIVACYKNYEELRHYFKINIEADDRVIDYFRVNTVHEIKDLYLVPANKESALNQ